jgi:hypothetical protein
LFRDVYRAKGVRIGLGFWNPTLPVRQRRHQPSFFYCKSLVASRRLSLLFSSLLRAAAQYRVLLQAAAARVSHSARRGNATAAPRRRIEKGGACGGGGSAMRGSGRGGGGRQPYLAWDGADMAVIPQESRKMVQSLKGILADRSEAEIYTTLRDCGMDPDVAVERLISQGILRSLPFAVPSPYRFQLFWRGYPGQVLVTRR